MKKQWLVIVLVWVISGAAVRAEMRMWTDKKGNSIEAEFVKIFSGKVVLKLANGKQVKVPQSGLSKEDQEYLKSAIPPKIDIHVDIDKKGEQTSSDGYGYSSRRKQKIKGHVTLTKKNRDPSSRQFTAYLYVFAKELRDDEIWVLDTVKEAFSFENQKTFEFSGNQRSVNYTDYSDGADSGDQYEGYLVFIEDEKGSIIYMKGSSKLYESKISQIKNSKNNARFDDDMNPLSRKNKKKRNQ